MTTEEPSFVDRVVEVLADRGEQASPRWNVGSGLLVGVRTVLTSSHVLSGAVTVVVRALVRDIGEVSGESRQDLTKRTWPAKVLDPGEPSVVDMALLTIEGSAQPASLIPLSFIRIERRSHLPLVISGCAAVGFPRFMEQSADEDGPSNAGPIRETVQVTGEIPTHERLISGLLTLRVASVPRALPQRDQTFAASPWAGMSGACVLVQEKVVGVVTEHFPRAGDSQLTVTPITHIDRLPEPRRLIWQQALDIDLDTLPYATSNLEPVPTIVKPHRMVIFAAIVLALICGILGAVAAGRLGWGLTVAASAFTAVVLANAGARLLRVSQELDRQAQWQPDSRVSGKPGPARTVDVTGHDVSIRGSLIAAGDIRQTNIKVGGVLALVLAGVLVLFGSVGTVATSTFPGQLSTDLPLAQISTAAVSVRATTSTLGSWTCPSTSLGSRRTNLLSAETTLDQLTTALRGMQRYGGRIDEGASALLRGIEAQNPPPSTATEALGRLRFANIGVDSLLKDLNAAIRASCGQPEFADSQLSYFAERFTPRPIPGGVVAGDAYGQCGVELGWIAPFSQVLNCGNGTVVVIDMGTGATKRLSGFPNAQSGSLTLAGNELAWISIATQPAQGLSRETWRATLHIYDIGSQAVTTTVADEAEGPAPRETDILDDAWPNRFLLYTQRKHRMVDSVGNTLWTSDEVGSPVRTTRSTLWFDPVLLNFNSGETLRRYGTADLNYYFKDNGCGNSAVLHSGSASDTWLTESPEGQIDILPIKLQRVNIVLAATGTLVNMDSSSGLHGIDLSGTPTWDIPSTIAKGYSILGRWIVVTNPSGQRVLVDATTGKDETGSHAVVSDALFRAGDRPQLVLGDPVSDIAIVKGASAVMRASWSSICV